MTSRQLVALTIAIPLIILGVIGLANVKNTRYLTKQETAAHKVAEYGERWGNSQARDIVNWTGYNGEFGKNPYWVVVSVSKDHLNLRRARDNYPEPYAIEDLMKSGTLIKRGEPTYGEMCSRYIDGYFTSPPPGNQ